MPTNSTVVTHWFFHCPECGSGDAERGHLATAEMIWCEFCLEEQRHVRLKRWPAVPEAAEESGALASGGGPPGSGLRDALLRRRTFFRGD